MAGALQDVRYSLRQLHRSPGFTAIAVLTLALGIGLNGAIFAIFDALTLRPLPVRDPNTLVNVYQQVQGDGDYRPFSYPEYVALLHSNRVFSGLTAYAWIPAEVATGESPAAGARDARGLLVTSNYFSLLGASTVLGRTFLLEEGQSPGSDSIVVLSHAFWEQQFGSDPSIVGKSFRFNGTPLTVVGVTDASFVGTEPQIPDFWAPMMMQAQLMPGDDRLRDRNSFWLDAVARLNPGTSRLQAQTAMNGAIRSVAEDYLGAKQDVRVVLTAGSFLGRPDIRSRVNSLAFLVLASVTMILLIACANVANLSLARAAGKQRELGVRLSLGASGRRIVQSSLTESLLIAMFSGAIGLVLARFLPAMLISLLQPPYEQTFKVDIGVDGPVLAYTVLLSLLTAVVFGLVPALRAAKTNPSLSMKDPAAFARVGRRSGPISLLVAAEISVCLVLLLGAGLLIRALNRAQTIDIGFETKNVLSVSLDLNVHGYDDRSAAEFNRRLTERLRGLPEVQSSSVVSLVPLGGVSRAAPLLLPASNNAETRLNASVGYWVVSATYFSTLGIPIVRGRSFDEQDTRQGRSVAIINEAMARRFWPGQDPLGKQLRPGPPSVPFVEVVGVARNTRGARLWEADQPYLYLPLLQTTDGPPVQTGQLGMKLLVRTKGNPDVVSPMILRTIRTIDPNVQATITTLEKSAGRWLWFSQVGATLSSTLGLIGLLLASAGIYGLMAYSVEQRTHELGIRMALGADRNAILKLIVGQGLRITLWGMGIGLGVAVALTRTIAAMLYGVKPTDTLTFAAVVSVLTVVAVAAAYLPARRAAKADPIVALRCE
jgi:predicted permease